MSSTTPFNGTQSGTYVSTSGGSETFTRTVSNQSGVRTAHAVFTLPDGKTVTRDSTLTKTATGWTRDVVTTLANGKTATLVETGTTQQGGPTTVTGTLAVGNNPTVDISGTVSNHGGTVESALSFSNPWGNTRTVDTQGTISSTGKTIATTGTNWSGATFSDSGALTILQSQAT